MNQEDLVTYARISDLDSNPKPTGEDVKVFGGMNIKQFLDSYEERIGIRRKPTPKPTPSILKNVILEPEKDHDKELLNELLNTKDKYRIIKWSENWDRTGHYKIFIIYEEFKPDAKTSTERA